MAKEEDIDFRRAPEAALEDAARFLHRQRRLDPQPAVGEIQARLLSEILHELHDQTLGLIAVHKSLELVVAGLESLRSPVVPVSEVIQALVAAREGVGHASVSPAGS